MPETIKGGEVITSRMVIGSLGHMMDEFHSGVYDFTDNGECIKCGECCSNILPMSEKEIKIIKRYIKKHKIKEHKHVLPIKEYYDATCPFLDDEHRCTIYKVRPLICRSFKCDKYNHIPREMMNKEIDVINVRETFFSMALTKKRFSR